MFMKLDRWELINGTEVGPDPDREADKYVNFTTRRDRELATIVLAVDVCLLYFIGNLVDATVVCTKLSGQF